MQATRSARQSATVDIVTLLLVLAGDHEESANANALALLRLSEPVPVEQKEVLGLEHHGP